jgi:hypothetical protein
MFVEIHIDAFTAKPHAFDLKPEALLRCSFSAKFDLSSSTDDALPGEPGERCAAKQAGNSSMIEWITSRRRNLAVRGDLSFGDGTDDSPKGGVALLV